MPYIKSGIEAAYNHDQVNRLIPSNNPADYKIGGMNMGWETTGRNISTIVVRNLSLVANTNQIFWGNPPESNTPGFGLSAVTTIFPNPVTGSSINFEGKEIQTISIVNCLGQEVIHWENAGKQNEPVNVDGSILPWLNK